MAPNSPATAAMMKLSPRMRGLNRDGPPARARRMRALVVAASSRAHRVRFQAKFGTLMRALRKEDREEDGRHIEIKRLKLIEHGIALAPVRNEGGKSGKLEEVVMIGTSAACTRKPPMNQSGIGIRDMKS